MDLTIQEDDLQGPEIIALLTTPRPHVLVIATTQRPCARPGGLEKTRGDRMGGVAAWYTSRLRRAQGARAGARRNQVDAYGRGISRPRCGRSNPGPPPQ